MSNESETLLGGCQCGAIRYQLSQAVLELYVCHCRECQKQSASAFGISFIVPQAALQLLQGEPNVWSRSTDSGNTLDCAFCPTCGSRLWHQRRGASDVLSVKGGSLDKPVDLSQAIHIWTSRMLPGIVIPQEADQFSGEPDRS
ncbi:GFA family protein [Pseudoxanthomonas sp. UTMC 1351]|uniref:GFA family protein n=1 Tax=Pseudoxanthomonas sp. UTMC 1351 TaxID=2695853 RepID=UPI0034CD0480